MCGIIGLFPFPLKEQKYDSRAISAIQRMLFSETLVALEPRGRDSSGIGLLWNDGKVGVIKQAIPSPLFVRDDGTLGEDFVNPATPSMNFSSFISLWNRGVGSDDIFMRAALGHVRKGTQGSANNTHNNHPIIIPPDGKLNGGDSVKEDTIIGVHNGGIQNDNELFKKHKFNRIGKVDSEVIFHLISKYKNDISVDNLEKTFEELEGAFAVMAYNNSIPNKVGCIREVRPMEAAYSPELGTLIIVSERKYLDDAWDIYDRWRVRESDTSFCYEDNGETINMGKVKDLFPYVSYSWYGGKQIYNTSSVEEGVFVLDLDQEVDDKTAPEDLIDVKKLYKKASSTYYEASYGGHRTPASTPATVVNDNRSVKENTNSEKTQVKDTTNYEVQAQESGKDEECTEGQIVEVDAEVIDGEIEDDTMCSYSWEELYKIGKKMFYDGEVETDNMLISKDIEEIRRTLEKYNVKAKEGGASELAASMYDVVFPEGFAEGYKQGYEQASIEYMALFEQEETEVASELENANRKIENMKHAIGIIKEKKEKATKRISSTSPILKALLLEKGIISKSGIINHSKLTQLMKSVGIKEVSKHINNVIKLSAK